MERFETDISKACREHFNVSDAEDLERYIEKKYGESWRFYHTLTHVNVMMRHITINEEQFGDFGRHYNDALIAAIFHDIVYYPWISDNEDRSIESYKRVCAQHEVSPKQKVIDMIEATKYNELPDAGWVDDVVRKFHDADRLILKCDSLRTLIDYEEKIMKEFQFVDYSTYKQKRLEFLDSVKNENRQGVLNYLAQYVEQRRPKIGIYAGSFNPFHIGHLDILEQAERDFDKVIVAIGKNPEKEQPERKKHVQDSVVYRQVEEFEGLLTDYMKEKEQDCDVTLIRGLRDGHDLEYEINQSRFMAEVADMKEIPTVYYVCNRDYSHISSSAIRHLQTVAPGKEEQYLVE